MGGFCSNASPEAVTPAGGDDKPYSGTFADDLTMGLATIGLGTEAQAEKLEEMGYSDAAIKDYQDRTAETKASPPSFPDDDDDKPAPKPEPEPEPEPEVVEEDVTIEKILDDIPKPPPEITEEEELLAEVTEPEPEKEGEVAKEVELELGAGSSTAQAGEEEAETLREIAKGPAEKKVADTVEAGRRSTIETTPQGLTTTAKTRRRRSMISGEELEEGLLN